MYIFNATWSSLPLTTCSVTSSGPICYEISQYCIQCVILTSPSCYLISTTVNPKDKINLISGVILRVISRFQGHASFGSSGYSFLTEQCSKYLFHIQRLSAVTKYFVILSFWILETTTHATGQAQPFDSVFSLSAGIFFPKFQPYLC